MGIVFVISLAEIIQARLSIFIIFKSVFRAFAMTGKFHIALLALAGKRGVFQATECLLLFSIKHVYQGFILDISQFVLWVNKMIAIIDITIHFQRKRTTAGWRKYTYLWR